MQSALPHRHRHQTSSSQKQQRQQFDVHTERAAAASQSRDAPTQQRRNKGKSTGTKRSSGACRHSSPHAAPAATAPNISLQQQLLFERNGFTVVQGLLQQQAIADAKAAVQQAVDKGKLQSLRQRVRVLCPDVDPASIKNLAQAMKVLTRHGTDEVGFLQFFHLHRRYQAIWQLVSSPALAGAAAQLLGVAKVRLYQDCVFLKEPGFAETNWHSDLRMAPFDTNHFVTAWVPLRVIRGSEDDSGLFFACGSHRDFALPFWHSLKSKELSDRGYITQGTGPMQPGDVSFHHGWTLHCAGPQPPGSEQRLAIAVCYFADGARLLARKGDPSVYKHMLHSEDAESYQDWLSDMREGAVAKHKLLPVVYDAKGGVGA